MNCLTDEQIQLLIDNETDSQIKDSTLSHIRTCEECRSRYEARKKFIETVKYQLNTTIPQEKAIPPFRYKKAPKRFRKVSVWIKIAAVLIPAIVVVKLSTQSGAESGFVPTNENIMLYELSNNTIDANTAYQQNMMITTVKDAGGKIINYQIK